MMTEVNPYASPQMWELSANTTRLGAGRWFFWLATVCLFLSGAVLMHLGTIPFYLLNPFLWLFMLPLWFVPIIVSDSCAAARRAAPHRSGTFIFIASTAKLIGIVILVIFIAACSALFLTEVLVSSPAASVKFQEIPNGMAGELERGVPHE